MIMAGQRGWTVGAGAQAGTSYWLKPCNRLQFEVASLRVGVPKRQRFDCQRRSRGWWGKGDSQSSAMIS